MEWVYMWSNPEAIVKCPLQLNFFLLWHIRLNLSDLQKISKYKNKNCDWEQARDMAITEQALSFNICTFSREYKEWKMVSTNIYVKRNRILQQWSGNQSFQRTFISDEKEQAKLFFFFFFFFKTRKFEFKLHLFPHLIEGIQLIW